jgi:hypothetical protein
VKDGAVWLEQDEKHDVGHRQSRNDVDYDVEGGIDAYLDEKGHCQQSN